MSAGRLEVQLIKTFFEVLRKMQRLLIQPDTRCSWTTDTGSLYLCVRGTSTFAMQCPRNLKQSTGSFAI
jgi:hypothetical protein